MGFLLWLLLHAAQQQSKPAALRVLAGQCLNLRARWSFQDPEDIIHLRPSAGIAVLRNAIAEALQRFGTVLKIDAQPDGTALVAVRFNTTMTLPRFIVIQWGMLEVTSAQRCLAYAAEPYGAP